ncbi:MAG: aminotransferase class V-fold PLP-dependent enzyme [Phycisphaerae bacterium]|nr:aminotransferase class V-fold PLP-dependent enzyme [Phycisphaerae bacterium]
MDTNDTVIYLDNAATSWPKPSVVSQAMSEFLAKDAANPGRAGHRMAVAAEKMLDQARGQLTELIGGTDSHRLIFTMNCTDALNIAFKGFLRAGDHVITTTLEHNSVSRPLQAMADAGFISLTRVEFSPQTGVIDPADVQRAIGPKTKLIALSHAGNVLGTIQPAPEVGRIARNHNVKFLLDAAQTMGVVPIDVVRQHVDMLAFPGHKSLLGPTGTGGLYVHTSVAVADLAAFREGGTGGDSSSPLQPRIFPYFLEGGTPNTVGVAGLAAAARYVHSYGPEKILAYERQLVQRFVDAAGDIAGVFVYGPTGANAAANRVGTISFNVDGHSPHEIGGILDEAFSMAVRPGLHCSPYAHKQIGSFPEGTVRLSPGHFNTPEDIDALAAALREITA